MMSASTLSSRRLAFWSCNRSSAGPKFCWVAPKNSMFQVITSRVAEIGMSVPCGTYGDVPGTSSTNRGKSWSVPRKLLTTPVMATGDWGFSRPTRLAKSPSTRSWVVPVPSVMA